MSRRIKKVAVLGSGIMGSGIACHFANIGLEVLMLDIVPFDLSDEEKNNPAARNRIVNGALKAALKARPAALFDKRFASRITTGNFDDDFEKIKAIVFPARDGLSQVRRFCFIFSASAIIFARSAVVISSTVSISFLIFSPCLRCILQ